MPSATWVRLVKHSLTRDHHLMWECLYLPSAMVEAHKPWHQQCGQAPTTQKNLTKANKLSETWRDILHEMWRHDTQLWFPNMVAHQDHLQGLLFFFFLAMPSSVQDYKFLPTKGSNLSSCMESEPPGKFQSLLSLKETEMEKEGERKEKKF